MSKQSSHEAAAYNDLMPDKSWGRCRTKRTNGSVRRAATTSVAFSAQAYAHLTASKASMTSHVDLGSKTGCVGTSSAESPRFFHPRTWSVGALHSQRIDQATGRVRPVAQNLAQTDRSEESVNSRFVEKPHKNRLGPQQDLDGKFTRWVPLRLKLQDLLRPDTRAQRSWNCQCGRGRWKQRSREDWRGHSVGLDCQSAWNANRTDPWLHPVEFKSIAYVAGNTPTGLMTFLSQTQRMRHLPTHPDYPSDWWKRDQTNSKRSWMTKPAMVANTSRNAEREEGEVPQPVTSTHVVSQ